MGETHIPQNMPPTIIPSEYKGVPQYLNGIPQVLRHTGKIRIRGLLCSGVCYPVLSHNDINIYGTPTPVGRHGVLSCGFDRNQFKFRRFNPRTVFTLTVTNEKQVDVFQAPLYYVSGLQGRKRAFLYTELRRPRGRKTKKPRKKNNIFYTFPGWKRAMYIQRPIERSDTEAQRISKMLGMPDFIVCADGIKRRYGPMLGVPISPPTTQPLKGTTVIM